VRPWGGRGWPEVGDGADGWAPSVREREGRREEGEVGWRWWAAWAESGDGPRGREVGWVCFFSFLFSNPFQIFSKPF
jgi:hypothetical protein